MTYSYPKYDRIGSIHGVDPFFFSFNLFVMNIMMLYVSLLEVIITNQNISLSRYRYSIWHYTTINIVSYKQAADLYIFYNSCSTNITREYSIFTLYNLQSGIFNTKIVTNTTF